jgi:hypothetical protein
MCEMNAPYIILLLDILNEASYKISAIIVVAVLWFTERILTWIRTKY